jgi:hypothetical protein
VIDAGVAGSGRVVVAVAEPDGVLMFSPLRFHRSTRFDWIADELFAMRRGVHHPRPVGHPRCSPDGNGQAVVVVAQPLPAPMAR